MKLVECVNGPAKGRRVRQGRRPYKLVFGHDRKMHMYKLMGGVAVYEGKVTS